ncbi:MAG: hypothetical protein RSC07_03660 [Mucinivorans sp.]
MIHIEDELYGQLARQVEQQVAQQTTAEQSYAAEAAQGGIELLLWYTMNQGQITHSLGLVFRGGVRCSSDFELGLLQNRLRC